MAIRPIIILPDAKLRLISAPVLRVDDSMRKLMDDMVETMHDAPGIGLAAIQVGEPQRLVVLDLAKQDEAPAPMFFANPEIIWSASEKSVFEEGCLSIPEYYEDVERPASVRVRFLDREGDEREILA
jgi:peptide deformylase